MPFPFALPTTSHIAFSDQLSSTTHPSLPLTTTTYRGVLRDALKRYKRLPVSSRPSSLLTILAALDGYLPYLFVLDFGLSGKPVAGEDVDIVLEKEPTVSWRSTLSSARPGQREPPRVSLHSLEYEIFFVLSTLAYTYTLLARAQLHTLYSTSTPTTEERTAAIAAAMKYLLDAHAVHTYLLHRTHQWASPAPVIDISPSVLSALASLSLAEGTLIAVLKDDPHPAAVTQDRNKADKEWMFKAPSIPQVRAHLFARLCLAAAEHAGKAHAQLAGGSAGDGGGGSRGKSADDLVKYVDDLRRTAKGKACRFFGIDAEMEGKTGEAIAWLRAARKEMGLVSSGTGEEEQKRKILSKLKKDWSERREDKRIEKGGEWGTDAGKFEEGRVIDMLERQWVKMNDTMNVQPIPPLEPLLASMPSGREYHSPKPFVVPTLDETTLARMRAPVDPTDSVFHGQEDDSEDEDIGSKEPIGAFSGTNPVYSSGSSYY